MGGRIDVEADDVAQLAHILRVVRELDLSHPVRCKAVRTPDALDGTRADIDDLRAHRGGPVGRLCWRIGLGAVTTRSMIFDPGGGMREGRVFSRRGRRNPPA